MTENYTPELHARLRELHQQASPAPWVADEDDDQRYLCAKGYEVITSYAEHVYEIDAQASVEARNTIPALLDEIERLQNKLETAKAEGWNEGYKASRTFEAQHRISDKFGKDIPNEPINPYEEQK